MQLLRSFGAVMDVRKIDETRTREFVISTSRVDSHGTVLPVEKWEIDDFNRAGGFYYQHNTGNGWNEADPDNQLGPATARYEDGELIGVGTFEPEDINPRAEKILRKVDFGSMKCTSVGFTHDGWHWGDERNGEDPTIIYFEGQHLREWSIVHIPSNPDAMKKAFEPMDKFMLEAIEAQKSKGLQKDIKRAIMAQKRADLFINKLFIQ